MYLFLEIAYILKILMYSEVVSEILNYDFKFENIMIILTWIINIFFLEQNLLDEFI